MANYSNYTNKEMQAITIAKIIEDGQIVIVGTGLPLIGASLAKRVFAPNCKLIVIALKGLGFMAKIGQFAKALGIEVGIES